MTDTGILAHFSDTSSAGPVFSLRLSVCKAYSKHMEEGNGEAFSILEPRRHFAFVDIMSLFR